MMRFERISKEQALAILSGIRPRRIPHSFAVRLDKDGYGELWGVWKNRPPEFIVNTWEAVSPPPPEPNLTSLPPTSGWETNYWR